MTDIPPDFSCHRCGTCCRWTGHVLLTPEDVTTLASTLNISEEDFVKMYTVLATNRAHLSLTEKPDGSCCFLADDNTCIVYSARPRQCAEFPKGWQVSGCPQL